MGSGSAASDPASPLEKAQAAIQPGIKAVTDAFNSAKEKAGPALKQAGDAIVDGYNKAKTAAAPHLKTAGEATSNVSEATAKVTEALRRQHKDKKHAGAEYLFGPHGLHPSFWGVNKRQLCAFRQEVVARMALGLIEGQPDPTKPDHARYSEKLLVGYRYYDQHRINFTTGNGSEKREVPLFCVDWAPDGKTLAVASLDNACHVVRVDGTVVRRLKHPAGCFGVAFCPLQPGVLASSCADGAVRVWELGSDYGAGAAATGGE